MTPAHRDPLDDLAELASGVDSRFRAIQQRNSGCMECRSGCSDCCRSRLSVTHVEATFLRRGLERYPTETRRRLAARAALENRDVCPALDASGRCEIYELRPMACRSFGVPLRRRHAVRLFGSVVDACDKNFRDRPLGQVDPEDVLDQTDLDAALAEIDLRYRGQRGLAEGERIPLYAILGGSWTA